MSKRYPSCAPIGTVLGANQQRVIGERCDRVERIVAGKVVYAPHIVLREASLAEFLAEDPARADIGARLTHPNTRYYLVSMD